MSVIVQNVSETADDDGNAIFTFPAPPQGQTWCGPVATPNVPSAATGMVYVGGTLVGATYGGGNFGPFVADAQQVLAVVMTGLLPDIQYQAVWHVDTAAATTPTPTPVVLLSGPGLGGVGVESAAVLCPAGSEVTLHQPTYPFQMWSWGWLPTGTLPTAGQAIATFGETVTDAITLQEGGSDRLAGVRISNQSPACVFTNNFDEEVYFYMNYSP